MKAFVSRQKLFANDDDEENCTFKPVLVTSGRGRARSQHKFQSDMLLRETKKQNKLQKARI